MSRGIFIGKVKEIKATGGGGGQEGRKCLPIPRKKTKNFKRYRKLWGKT